MNIITNPHRQAAYKIDLFAEIDDLEARLEASKIQKTLLIMTAVLSLAISAWLIFILLIVHGTDFSDLSATTPLHRVTQQEIINQFCPKNESSFQKTLRADSDDHGRN